MHVCVMGCMKTIVQQCVNDLCTNPKNMYICIFYFLFLIVNLQAIVKKKTSTTPFHWFLVCDEITEMW